MILPKAGLVHSGAAKLPTMEGATGTFGVRLSKGPPANVAVAVSASGDAKIVEVYGAVSATVATTTLTFTPANWAVTQTVAVTADDNNFAEDTPSLRQGRALWSYKLDFRYVHNYG